MRFIELAGIGPGPMCAMLLADLGATVLRIDRPEPADLGINRPLRYNLTLRSRETLALDLKLPAARDLVLRLVEHADGLMEGFRPGVVERLGLGPDVCLARNRRLVFGRMTGWGQDGPLAPTAGHDIDYIALTGALDAIGRPGAAPTVPLNLLGDFGGGALYLALGMLAAVISARSTGAGQVVDAAIVDGTASLLTALAGSAAAGLVPGGRGTNLLDGGAYFYDTYECADGRHIAVGSIERRFHDIMLRGLGLDPADFPNQMDRDFWPAARARLAERIRTRSRDEWAALFAGTDACVSPVLTLQEAPLHPHMAARGAFVDVDGVVQPAPAPRFSATPAPHPTAPSLPDSGAALSGWLPPADIAALREQGVIA